MGARRVAGLTGAVFIDVAGSQRRSRVAFALPNATGVAAPESEVWHFDLGDRDADKIFSLLTDQFALRNILLQVLLDLAPYDLPETEIILFNIENHLLGPSCFLPWSCNL